MVYDGSTQVRGDLKAAFPQGKVYAYQSRRADGTPYYNIHSGENAFIPAPGGKAYFAGEEITWELGGPVNQVLPSFTLPSASPEPLVPGSGFERWGASDWTAAPGEGLEYPGDTHAYHSGFAEPSPVVGLPTQAEADAVAAEAKAEEVKYETVHYQDGSYAYGVAPMPRFSPEGSPAIYEESK